MFSNVKFFGKIPQNLTSLIFSSDTTLPDGHEVAEQLQRDHIDDALQCPVSHRHAHSLEQCAVYVSVI